MTSATVVGAGPNGLAAAVALAKAGLQVTVLEAADEIGGGTRTSEAIMPGLLHDHCSAIHPMAVGSQFLGGLGLDRYGLSWWLPEIDCVHPLDGGSAGVLYRPIETTAAGLGSDGARWRRLFGKTSANFDALSEDIMGPLLRVPRSVDTGAVGAPNAACIGPARWFRSAGPGHCSGAAAHASATALPDDIGDRSGHSHRGPPPGGRWRWAGHIVTNASALLSDPARIETGTRIEIAS
jgi:phytoene dehydrogenase-like protein